MNSDAIAELGLERMLTTSELADYLGVGVQAIYDLRLHGRGPAGIRIGRELRYTVSDGQTRQVTATASSSNAAKMALKAQLADRVRASGASDALTADSPFPRLAGAWLEQLRIDPDRSEGTKEVYERELRSLVLLAWLRER
jgi:hypothetical protein